MTTLPTEPVWTKAIPPARDRLQSRILVGLATCVFVYIAYLDPEYLVGQAQLSNVYLRSTLLLSVSFAYIAWRLKAATPAAAVFGGIVCLFVTVFSSIPRSVSPFHSALSPLILLFVVTFQATRAGRRGKVAAGLAEPRNGRSAAQIVANLGVAAIIGSPAIGWRLLNMDYSGQQGHIDFVILCAVPAVAALAEATADTVSSEIGQAFGGAPRMVLTLRPVPPGTDGAVTLLGTLAGIASAALIALTGIPALGMNPVECFVAFAAGVAGLFFDSLLGATLERRGWLGNDLVNFSSTAFSAALALVAIRAFADRLF